MATATLKDQSLKDKADILTVIETLKTAHHNKDAAYLAARFTPDAAIFNLAPPLVHHGVDLHEKQEWFDSWDGPIEMEPKDFDITVSGDFAFCHGYMRMGGNKVGVDQRISFWMRATFCLQRSGDTWRIVHEHTSVPFSMDGNPRPVFDLKP
ncbi:MAG TPA: nuclear transport factor 2 family protein [Acidobacteriaceae bacterium]|nr:nuclear transport factor 2 family protein [Acidobacteriaceae bacterium]